VKAREYQTGIQVTATLGQSGPPFEVQSHSDLPGSAGYSPHRWMFSPIALNPIALSRLFCFYHLN
jgi:hypothetical protein